MISIKSIDHFVITTDKMQEILAFYKKLGFKVTTKANESELAIGDFKINVQNLGSELTPHAQNIKPGSVDICFRVQDTIDELKQCLQDAQLSIDMGPVSRVGAKGNMESIYVRDPDGNLLEFATYIN